VPRSSPGDADGPDEKPQPGRRVELRRAVHLEAEPRAPPVVGERGVELGDLRIVLGQVGGFRRVVEDDVMFGG
jgi:hypothetical protein